MVVVAVGGLAGFYSGGCELGKQLVIGFGGMFVVLYRD